MQRIKTTIKRHFPALVPLMRILRSTVERTVGSTTNPLPMADVFTRAYRANYRGNSESHSGPGSDLKQTAVIRVEIPKLIEDLGIKSMLDIPCGDFFWIRECKLAVEIYIGADIVSGMIRELNEHYGSSHRSFEVLDLSEDVLPKVDLVLCRDAFVHFSLSDIRRAVANLKRSGSTYPLSDDLYRSRSEYRHSHQLGLASIELATCPNFLSEAPAIDQQGLH